MRGRRYDAEIGTGRDIWEQVQARLQRHGPVREVAEPVQRMWGDPRLVRQRLGQGAFRLLVTDTYQRRCAVAGEKAPHGVIVYQASKSEFLDDAHKRDIEEVMVTYS